MSGKLPIYRFTVTIGATLIDTSPVWGEDASVKRTREDGQMFFRTELTGTFRFVRGDYDQITAAATLEDEIFLTVEEFTGTWDLVSECIFTLADCEIDEDHRHLSVQLQPDDKYREILAAMDREFDLIRLAVPTVSVSIVRQPIIQIYVQGSNYLNNYLNGTFWEQPVIEPIYSSAELNNFEFNNFKNLIFIPGDTSVLDPDVSGEYVYNGSGNNYLRNDGHYEIRLDPVLYPLTIQWQIVDKLAADTVVYQKPVGEGLVAQYSFERHPAPFDSMTSASQCDVFMILLYCRILTNSTTVFGNPTIAVPDPDIVAENPYSRVIGYDLSSVIGSITHQAGATIYGKIAEDALHYPGEYLTKPVGWGSMIYPVSNSEWTAFGVWFYFNSELNDVQESGGITYNLRDGFKLPDILFSILGELDTTVSHGEAPTYSDFFYGTSNPIRGDVKYPIFTPKTNITVGEYDQPAAKAPVTLRQILDFLKNAHNVYWWIDDRGNLCLEHLFYFENGKSYTTPGVDADLTELFEPKSGKPWSYKTTKYKFRKEGLYEVRRFAWMDGVSRPFGGYPIEPLAKYINRGEVVESNLSPFTSDIDFMQVQPEGISKDGFAFMEAIDNAGTLELPFVEFEIDAEEQYKMQNGYAALVWMIDAYHRYYLPCEDVKINDRDDTAMSVARFRVQQVTYPGTADPMLLITTVLGDGRVKEIEQSLSTKMSKITVLHDPV